MKDLTGRMAALSAEQRALFEARLRERGLRAPAADRIPRRPSEDVTLFPTSIDQERLWFIEQLQPGNSAYNIFSASRIRGPLDAAVMQRVVGELIARHEVLRTTFAVVDDQPVQVVHPEMDCTLAPVDLGAWPEAEREREALRLVTEDFARPFDLERGPLFRIGLLRLADDDHVLHVNMHHTVTDRWSGAIFERETGALYEAFARGLPSPLAPLPIQYADYALWQRGRAEGEIYREQAAYWSRRLAGAPLVLEVPTDYPRPPVQTFRGARVYTRYPLSLLDALRELARREGVTMFTLALAAYKALLYRYTGQETILVGSTFANRNRPELQHMVGYLLNLIPLSTDLSGDPTFRELLVREREAVLGGFANQELPFGKLVQALRPAQDASRNPVVQHSLIYLDFPELTVMETLGLSARHLDIDNGASRFDMTLAMTETPRGYEVDIEYPTALYRRERVERMTGHLRNILEAVVADPGLRLSELPVLGEEESRRLLVAWNATQSDYPRGVCAHELFEAQAARTPDAVAVVCEGERLTYRELNARANRVARRLAGAGVGAGALVGLCLERSARMVVGLLGVLKAGAAYVPLDERYPAERLSFMLEDSGARVLLTEASLLGRLPRHGARPVCLDADWGEHDAGDGANPGARVGSGQRAYVIYTSGSTGRPKGVELTHGALVNLLTAVRRQTGFDAADTLLAVSTLSFDIATTEILLPLISGGRVHVAGREAASDGARLARLLAESGATVMQATPATWRMLLAADWRGDPRLKVFSTGEALDRPLADQLLGACGELWNLYGPTETTIYSGVTRVGPGEGPVPVGPPIANTRFYVLDRFMNPVPVGIYGELWIGGAGLARGYLGRPGLTAERFVPDPFSAEPGARLYKTGDLVRHLEDGSLEYGGRLDHQVKVRGFRIELGEVEAALARHPRVRAAVAAAREDRPGEQRLVAYVVCEGGAAPAPDEWREFLRERLPDYMIPSLFVALDELPLLPNGKVNRRALPAPDASRPGLRRAFVAPATPTEKRLAEIWADVLALKQIGARDDFFELGGDSILATRLASRVRRAFGVELPLRDLFWKPTVAGLAPLVEDLLLGQMETLSEEEAERLLREGA